MHIEGENMSKKEYRTKVIIFFSTGFIGILLIFLAATLQSNFENISNSTVYIVGFSGFLVMISGVIFGIINLSKIIKYEYQSTIDKVSKKGLGKFSAQPCILSKQEIIKKSIKHKHFRQLTEDTLWFKKTTHLGASFIYMIIFNNELNDDIEKALEMKLQMNATLMDKEKLPNAQFQATVFLNIVESVDQENIDQLEKLNQSALSIAKVIHSFAPIILYYLYDKNNGVIYYEKEKKHPVIARSIALKQMNKMIFGN